MKKRLIVLLFLLVPFLLYSFWSWDSSPPTLYWREAPSTVGRDTKIIVEIQDEGNGLQSIEVVLARSGSGRVLLSETYGAPWPWQKGVSQRSIALSPEVSFGEDQLSEGEFWLEVNLQDQPNFWLWAREVSERRSFKLDLTPPQIEVRSGQHYIRQGGSEAIVYRVSQDTVASGVQVGEHVFAGYPLPESDKGTYVCLFALAQDQPPQTSMLVWAEDAAGNRDQTSFRKKVFPVRFRNREIHLTDLLMNTVVSEILEHTNEVTQQGTLLKTFLKINGHLRDLSHRHFEEFSRQSAGRLLWSEPFLQLSKSQVESAFADRRTYYYQGRKVDQQTHLGFDLASLAHSPVECANDGIVVLADYLGIYGNTVLVDHGLGLLSLYGHLSSIEVQKGRWVKRGEILGRTGQTGLAAGDHLHFSLILQGVQVNPLEWWDQRWVREHVLVKLTGARSQPKTR
ncbi:M23 family metallopeptidase [Acidobacteria bacterium AH-259-G07]|nr:M23 family metallopeptidase [Acidobacteria bacterium AH-259-G07]